MQMIISDYRWHLSLLPLQRSRVARHTIYSEPTSASSSLKMQTLDPKKPSTLSPRGLSSFGGFAGIMSAEDEELENSRFADAFNPAGLRYNCFFVALGRVSHLDSKMLATLASDDELKVDEACGADHDSTPKFLTPHPTVSSASNEC